MARMQPVRVPRVLPVILSPNEVRRLIAAKGNLKHQTALSIAYGTGCGPAKWSRSKWATSIAGA